MGPFWMIRTARFGLVQRWAVVAQSALMKLRRRAGASEVKDDRGEVAGAAQ